MTYASSTMVKQRMNISGSSRDNDILVAITYGDARCDADITANGGDGSISSPGQILKEAAADFAAYFMHRINNPTVATLFLNSAETLLANYVKAELKQGGSARTGKRDIHEE